MWVNLSAETAAGKLERVVTMAIEEMVMNVLRIANRCGRLCVVMVDWMRAKAATMETPCPMTVAMLAVSQPISDLDEGHLG